MIKYLKWILLAIAAALIVALFYFFYWPIISKTSHQFDAEVISVKDTEILANGFHVWDIDSDKTDTTKRSDVTIKFDSNTSFVKIVLQIPIPNPAGDKSTSTTATVKKDLQPGSIEELKDIDHAHIMITTLNNSIKDNTLIASEIRYSIVVPKK